MHLVWVFLLSMSKMAVSVCVSSTIRVSLFYSATCFKKGGVHACAEVE